MRVAANRSLNLTGAAFLFRAGCSHWSDPGKLAWSLGGEEDSPFTGNGSATLEMRGDIVYRVYGLHDGREKDHFFGAFRSRSEADAEIAKLSAMEMNGRNWAEQYHNRGFVIRETLVAVDFELPSQPKPRDKYVVKSTPKPNRPGTWGSTIVEVFRSRSSSSTVEKICEYERHYSLL